jgi:uncharacterized repeat protein (TIGR01451 family)
VNNDLATKVGSTLRNAVELNYTHGETSGTESETDGTAAIIAVEPELTSTKVLSNVTPAKGPADPPEFGDILEYVVTVMNGGNARAYDVNVVDTLPVELTLYGAVAPTAAINAAPVAGFVATPAGAPVGPLIWGRGNGDESLDLPAGGNLVLTYRVEVTTPTPDATLVENRIWVDWTSLDATTGYERTGDGCPTVTAPDDYCFGPAVASGTTVPVDNAPALLKQITQPSAQIGEAFTYTITVPETPYVFPISDVRVFDDLTASGVDLRFIRVAKISGTGPWTPVNTGTATSLVIEDTTTGIDIPAGEQIVLEITVVLEDTGANTSGSTFANTGSYLYNWINDDPASQRAGDPGTSADMLIVGSDDMTLEKSGPASMTLGTPETFTLDVQNIGSGRAWNLSVRDILPETASGGTCDAAPTSVTAQIFQSDRTTAVSAPLVDGVDFSTTFSTASSPCEFSLAMLSAAAALDATERLIITYQTTLDPGTQDGATLVNVAGTTAWFSNDGLDPDTAGDRRTYTRSVVNGSVLALDHEDAHTVLGALPLYVFDKTVANLTTPEDPATTAQPGDTLHYTLRVLNSGTTPIQNFSLYDVIDSINGVGRFVPGSMSNLVVPAGADISNTDVGGGPYGTGVLDVRNLNLPNQNDELFVEFDIILAPVIADGTTVTNQAEMRTAGVAFALSDDPGVNGTALPLLAGDEDPTSLTVASAPAFQVRKVSSYLDGDPALLLAGERLRYTLTVKNIGTDDAVDVVLRDDIPANTRYLAGSTTLNGTPLLDDPVDIAPFVDGLAIYAPEDPTPGAMRADTSAAANNVATLVFDVVVDRAAIDGTVIANQGFVSALSVGIVDMPSDDPATALADDPTRDVVGNSPLLFSSKSVVLVGDAPPLGVVDPGDILEYTITTYNNGAIPATGATLQDGVPASTNYVDDSLTRNGVGVGIPNGGVSPLIAGIDISSDDLPAPLPGGGTINPGQSAVVTFRLQVDSLTAVGTLISNQAVVGSDQLPKLLTDGDGNPATGPEPTVVVVGDGQQLSISKQVSVVGGGAALPGAELEYEVIVVNVATVPATNVVVTDNLALPVGGQLTYVPDSATLNGVTSGISATPTLVTANYSSVNGDLASGASAVLRFRAIVDGNQAMGTVITNVGEVIWDSPAQNATATADISVGGTPGVGIVRGTLWHDSDFDRSVGGTELALSGWVIELYRNGRPVQSVTADALGAYTMSGLSPNDVTGEHYELRFRAPDAAPSSAALGFGVSPFTNGPQRISDILVSSGGNLLGLDLPIQPNGVVYSALQRNPVPGATLALLGPGGAAVPASCMDDPQQQGQITRGDGYYKFGLSSFGAGCPSGGDYVIQVTPPATGFAATVSALIPPTTGALDPPFAVPTCPGGVGDAVPATAQRCEVQTFEFAPDISLTARSAETNYHLHLTLDSSQPPGSSQIFNNHIPLDPELDSAVGIVKTTSKLNVSVGELVPYEIVLTNSLPLDLSGLTIVDRFPAGFHYVEGSARIDSVPIEPTIAGRRLTWSNLDVAALDRTTVVLLLAVGSGVSEGEFSNHAHAAMGGVAISGVAAATVRVVPDPDFACTDVLGKVFDDVNRNGTQDDGEGGLAGVRLMTVRGLAATTDAHGRYHITCAVTPRDGRGSNFMLKLDDRTLPTGYRMSTRPLQIKRATQGKALRFNFGASIHRVVSLDLSDAVFEPTLDVIREQWKARLDLLIEQLGESPSRLRLSYVADVEDESLVERRLERVERIVREAWKKESSQALEIESEVFWRLGGPQKSEKELSGGPWRVLSRTLADTRRALNLNARTSAERHLPTDQSYMEWAQDPEWLAIVAGDKLEERVVLADVSETVKLKNVVPPIRFDSGVADIPSSTVDTLRVILDGMRHLDNVRLHLSGHSDDQRLSGRLTGKYGDNEGLSRERAGEVAEFIQAALSLPPESISYGWAGADEPVASNATEAGRAINRRVEVELWHDELRQKASVQDVVISEDIERVKVCRMETVCKLRMLEGHARRARVKNLIAPLRYQGERVDVTPEFLRQVGQALQNLGNKQNVTAKFIGYTNNGALSQREERIYGTHLAVSKARARLVSLKIKEALDLPSSAIASDGRGAARPVASNELALGRALNRRVEVEFWYDDPLQQLPDEPMLCPDAADTELVTRVYDPTWGRLAPLRFEGDAVEVPEGYAEDLRRAMEDVAGRSNVRLRFVGYTRNERLDRRTAIVYGDDIGLSAARARRTMEKLQAELGLSDEQVEHEGRGYLYSNDVVNAGFLQNDLSQVMVQVVYDEPAVLDEYEGIAITPIRQELRPKSPLDLNLMRISVNGEPIDDPGRSSADIQRCTDVALEGTDIEFRFDSMTAERRLSVTAETGAVGIRGTATTVPANAAPGSGAAVSGTGVATSAGFKTYSNYPRFLERSEIRIFEQGESRRSEPLAIVEVGPDGTAAWQPPAESFTAPTRELLFVLRAYDAEGRFDETAPQSLWVVKSATLLEELGVFGDHGTDGSGAGTPVEEVTETVTPGSDAAEAAVPLLGKSPLLEGYGESGPLITNIPLGDAGSVIVHGRGVPEDHTVSVAGSPVPMDENGDFVSEAILPSGLHTVEVNVVDEAGNGELFLRDLELKKSDWFYMGIADFTFFGDMAGGKPGVLSGENSQFDDDAIADGRLAFFVNGKFANGWKLTASADTREGPIEDLFSNFLDKSHQSLFRRIDPDYHYPTFGDEGTVEELAPTLGKFFVRLSKDESHLLWGNFTVGYRGNELALVERGLYGGNVHYESPDKTSFGESRLLLDGFAADSGTVPSREDFRGTGGSLYYLRHRDLLNGSDRLRIELRDKDSGLVTAVVPLREGLDYDIDTLQGRVLLSEPITATVADELLVRDDGLSGNEAWLVVQYEYTPGFDEIDTLSAGGRGHYWFGDFLKFGMTASRNDEDGAESSLYAADMTLRKSSLSWFKVQAGYSEGQVSTTYRSDDGGFDFIGDSGLGLEDANAFGYRADASIGFEDFFPNVRGQMSLYAQILEGGYTAPGLTTLNDTQQFGGQVSFPVLESVNVIAKADRLQEDDGLETTTAEVDVDYELTDQWSLSAGVRYDDREDDAPVVAATQEEGMRTDAVLEVGYDSQGAWSGYAFGQGTVASTGNREDNVRGGVGGKVRVSERIVVSGEVSYGTLGPAAQVGTKFQKSDRTSMYLNYGLDTERGVNGVQARRGNLVLGAESRFSDSASVFIESRFQHAKAETGLTRAVGMKYSPSERWDISGNLEFGTLSDRRTKAETDRRAVSGTVTYHIDEFLISSGIEYLFDDRENPEGGSSDRTTWFFRNQLKYQMTPDWKLVAKFNHSFSDSALGDSFDGGFTEAVLGYAYRPVKHDRLNALLKYTYFYNLPTAGQVSPAGTSPSEFIQKSHIAALDVSYDVLPNLTLGGKYAYRRGEVSLDRDDPDFFDNSAHLAVLRADLRFLKNWETLVEGRALILPQIDERKVGALLGLNRYFGKNFKAGVGYNFTDFSDDLTDLGYDHHGWFLNMTGAF